MKIHELFMEDLSIFAQETWSRSLADPGRELAARGAVASPPQPACASTAAHPSTPHTRHSHIPVIPAKGLPSIRTEAGTQKPYPHAIWRLSDTSGFPLSRERRRDCGTWQLKQPSGPQGAIALRRRGDSLGRFAEEGHPPCYNRQVVKCNKSHRFPES